MYIILESKSSQGELEMSNQTRKLSALYPVVGVDSPIETSKAMQKHFGLAPVFETDWYVPLKAPESELQLGLVRFDHESVPSGDRKSVQGSACFVTIDAGDVHAIWEARDPELDILQELKDEAWGQRHFICRLPGGLMVDVVQMLYAPQ